MKREEFKQFCASRIVILDGATGTELIKQGMVGGVCPELWVSQHPEALSAVQSAYQNSGSDIVYSPTFGGNRIKLANYHLEDQVFQLNCSLAELSRKAAPKCLVFGDISSTGHFVQPSGDMPFAEAVAIFREQAQGLLAGGVDGFAVETMMDVQEARAAVIAIREICDLPILVTMTFESGMHTLTGNDPVSALLALQALDIDGFGCNCSCGPEEMIEIIRQMAPFAKVPLIAKPNAGIPRMEDGKTKFSMTADQFAEFAPKLIESGVNLMGGCCGTSPEFIAGVAGAVRGLIPEGRVNILNGVCGPRQYCQLGLNMPLQIIGERINPTGKKALQQDLRNGKLDMVWQFAEEQAAAGASLLDVNLGLSGIDEKEMMLSAMRMLSGKFNLPLCFDTTSPVVAEAVLREYPGRAVFNSISAETVRLKEMLPLVAKYHPVLILLPVTDEGVPSTADARIEVIKQIFAEVKNFGYGKADVIVDVLAMTVAADPMAAKSALDTMAWCHEAGFATVCGLSNISHGMPRRDLLNRAFLLMGMAQGLNLAIANPMQSEIIEIIQAADVLQNRDGAMAAYLDKMSNAKTPENSQQLCKKSGDFSEVVLHDLMRGNVDGISASIDFAIKAGISPSALVDDILLPGIAQVGEKFERKEYFLPQLVGSADALKTAMDHLAPLLFAQGGTMESKGRVIIATVKGDIHDIGKNITSMMLKNYGFDVVDLGKDVPAEEILDKADEMNINVIGLSALMTTTMGQMKAVIDLARQRGMKNLHFIVGGAVVDEVYAESIGAVYASDAMATVRAVQKIFQA